MTTAPADPGKRRASYKKYRRPAELPRVAITNDDQQLFLELYRHGVLDSRAVYRLFPERSEQVLCRRLRKLYQAGYLHRLSQMQEVHVVGGGSLPEAYVLDAAGINWLEETKGSKLPERLKALRERSGSYLLHEIKKSHFVISVRLSVQNRDGVEFLYPEDIYRRFAPQILEREHLPRTVRARVDWHGYTEIEGTTPDSFFMLFYPDRPEGRQRRSIFLEIDMGNETINPTDRKIRTVKFWKDTSILRKLVVYAYALKTSTHTADFGIPTFQVLFVTTNPDKVAKMQSAYRQRLAGRPHHVESIRFLFTDFETLADYDDVLDAPIYDGAGNQIQIV